MGRGGPRWLLGRALAAEPFRQVVRAAVASGVAWGLGRLLGAPRPVFAVLAVLFSLQGNPGVSVRTALQRVIGVAGGVTLGVLAAHGPGLSPAGVAALVAAALCLGRRMRVGGTAHTQVAVSALLLLAVGGGWRYGAARLWETALGGAVAVAASLALWPGDAVAVAARGAAELRAALSEDLRAVAASFGASPREARARFRAVQARARAAARAVLELPAALEGAGWRPGADRRALQGLGRQVAAVDVLYRHVRALARLAADAAGRERHLAAGPLPEACAALAAAMVVLDGASARSARGALRRADRAVRALQGCGPVGSAAALELRELAADLRPWVRPRRAGRRAAREESASSRRIPPADGSDPGPAGPRGRPRPGAGPDGPEGGRP